MSTKKTARRFRHPHPIFNKNQIRKSKHGVWYEDSFYYIWWEFLKLNEDYRSVCLKGGEDSDFYKDFGDVFNIDFKDWWTVGKRGERLFSEQPRTVFKEVSSSEDLIIDNNHLTVTFALDLPLEIIQTKISSLLSIRLKTQSSSARYPSVGKVEIPSLKRYLEIYKLKSLGTMKNIEIADIVGYSQSKSAEHEYIRSNQGTDSIASKTQQVSRAYRKAMTSVKNAYSKSFPNL